MICPNCEEGTLNKICLKEGKRKAVLCDFCGTFWFENEDIGVSGGHLFSSYKNEKDLEYNLEDSEEIEKTSVLKTYYR